jgi:hypothetical protein
VGNDLTLTQLRPESAHIVWTKQVLPEAIVGMPIPTTKASTTGDSYERKEQNTIIMTE